MKSTHVACIAVCRFFSLPFFLFISLQVVAQNSLPFSGALILSGHNSSHYLRLNEVKGRAIRHFKKHFAFAANETWSLDNDYFVANFSEDCVRSKVYYYGNGLFACCVKYYEADELDKDLRSQILSKFVGSEITTITEVTDLESQVYFVKIKDAATVKTLQCMDGNIQVTESYTNDGN